MKKYVVYLTFYSGNLLPAYYIGSTTEDKILSGNYFGSITSKRWKDKYYYELKHNKNLFQTKILSFHSSRKEALEEELRIQILNNVVKSEDYFNESLASINGFFGRNVSGENHPNYGKKLTEEHKNKLKLILTERNIGNTYGKSNKGRICSNETKNRISEAHKGMTCSEITKIKMSKEKIGNKNNFYGKNHSNETKKLNSEKMKLNYSLLSEEKKLKNIINQKGRKNILQFDFNGNFIKEYISIREIERLTGFNRETISGALKGIYKQAHGFNWKYKNEKENE